MLRHKKKRNSFIVFEQLVGLITRLASAGNNTEASLVVDFLKKHFKSGTQLLKEYRLINEVLSSRGHPKEEADKIIDEVLSESKKLSTEKLEEEKTSLIQAINSQISCDLYNIPVRDYKLAASIQILMNEARSESGFTTPSERVKIKSLLSERLSVKENVKDEDKIDNLTFAVLVSKFNQRYSKLMNEDQRHLLSAWTNYLIDNNEEIIKKTMDEKIGKLKTCLSSHVGSLQHKDSDHETLLKEAYSTLVEKQFTLNEQSVYEVMRFFDLVEDLENYNEQTKI